MRPPLFRSSMGQEVWDDMADDDEDVLASRWAELVSDAVAVWGMPAAAAAAASLPWGMWMVFSEQGGAAAALACREARGRVDDLDFRGSGLWCLVPTMRDDSGFDGIIP